MDQNKTKERDSGKKTGKDEEVRVSQGWEGNKKQCEGKSNQNTLFICMKFSKKTKQ